MTKQGNKNAVIHKQKETNKMADLYTVEVTTHKQLLALLTGGYMHVTIDDALHGLPAHLRGEKPDGLPYSIWQLVDHIRIMQWDILKISTNPDHISPKWPHEYWPENIAPADEDEWQNCLDQISSDRQKFIDLITDEDQDLFEPFATEPEQTLFKQALLMADHTSYHLGQIVLMRRLLDAWH